MKIKTIRQQQNGFLVNGTQFVPKIKGNRHYTLVLEYLDDAGMIEPEFTVTELSKNITMKRYARLQSIFKEKTLGLKSLAIDEPWMTDADSINDQYRVYEEMYKNAKNGLYDDGTNNVIIQKHEAVKIQLAPLTLLINSAKTVLGTMIETDVENVDAMLDATEAIKLTKEDLTPEKIGEIQTMFGL
jgi:hypothetical protein